MHTHETTPIVPQALKQYRILSPQPIVGRFSKALRWWPVSQQQVP